MPAQPYCARCLTILPGDSDGCANMACKARRPLSGWATLAASGDTIDRRYRVMDILALGGAGVTYRVREVDDQGQVRLPDLAIKVLHTTRDSGPFLKRLANEAQVLKDLAHDNIVQCIGFVHREGHSPYLVTRFEPGGNLEEYVKRYGPLGGWTVAGIARQLFEALSMAHRKNVVHRDLKPANVLLHSATPPDQIPHIRIGDFGIAKVAGGLSSGMTRAGSFIGTPQFAAPEQFLGEPATGAADVFGAGSVVWYLLTGSPPIDISGEADLEDYFDLLRRSLPPRLPPELLADPRNQRLAPLIEGTMQAQAENRWTSDEAIDWLDWVLDLRPDQPVIAPRTKAAPAQLPPLPEPVELRRPATVPSPPPPHPAPAARPSAFGSAPTLMRDEALRAPGPGRVPSPPRLPPQAPAAPPPPLVDRGGPVPLQRPPPRRLDLNDLFAEEPTIPSLVRPGAPSPTPLNRPPLAAAGFEILSSGPLVWRPNPPLAPPDTLPDSAVELLRLIGVVHPSGRNRVLTQLLRCPPQALSAALQGHRLGEDAARGRGICVAAEGLMRRDLEAQVRSLLADKDPGVRVAAASALGRLAELSALKPLSEMLRDPDPRARAGIARALALAARAADRVALARHLLKGMENDPDPLVTSVVEAALSELEVG